MQWIESRLHALERRVEELYRRLLDLIAQVNAARQGLANAFAATSPEGSGGAGGYYGAILSGALAAGSGGAPASIASQTVWQLSSGARADLTGTFTIYNDTGSSIASSSQVLLAANPDGTFTVLSVACTGNS